MSKVTRAAAPVLLCLTACLHKATPVTAAPVPSGTVLTADDIRRSPGQSLEEMLIARVPGLTLMRSADGHAVMQLRGPNTFLGSEELLVVLNGIALGPTARGNLGVIDVHDIENVQVLRDAAATSLYGMRGANGVIVIRTKQN